MANDSRADVRPVVAHPRSRKSPTRPRETPLAAVAFTVGDADTPGSLVVTGTIQHHAGPNATGANGTGATVRFASRLPPTGRSDYDHAHGPDAGGPYATETFLVNVSAVNDAPVNSVPGAQNVSQNGSLQFSTAGSNLISIGDVDANSANISVKLGVAHGTVTLATTAGLASVTGNGTAAINMSGTVSAINGAQRDVHARGGHVGTDT
jgi:hypothetical protein